MLDSLEKINNLFENGLIESAISIAILLLFLSVLNIFINKMIQKIDPKNKLLIKRIKRGILYTIAIYGILSQFKALGPIVQGLLASGGIIAVILGLASQEVASDILSGVMIFIYKPYRIGDLISVSEHNVKGTVLDINVRHTIIETVEKTQVTVPNTIMNEAIVENISNITHQKNNYLYVDVAYDTDLDKAIAIIQEIAMNHPLFVDARSDEEKEAGIPAVKVYCMEFKESAVSLRASIFSKNNAEGFQMLSDLRQTILKRFKEENIEIPFPYRVLINKDNVEK